MFFSPIDQHLMYFNDEVYGEDLNMVTTEEKKEESSKIDLSATGKWRWIYRSQLL